MTEANVCIGDVYRIGADVLVQVSEPRSPCYKLNIRFQWPRALKRIQRTGRVGWNFRVLRTGFVQEGDCIVLVERPHPKWSVLNVKRVVQGRSVPLVLVQELAELGVLTDVVRGYAQKRLETAAKAYRLVEARDVTARVKQLTFALDEPITVRRAEFRPFAFAQIEFGSSQRFARSYSIVSGDMNTFSLGVALDDHSRGGSTYLHQDLKIGDEIHMAPGSNPKALADEERTVQENRITRRVVIIGGIGVTALLPTIAKWETEGVPYEIHYAVRSPDEAAYLDRLPAPKTTVYAKPQKQRLSVEAVVPEVYASGNQQTRIYCCGPTALMDACKRRAEELEYPAHLLHFESFGNVAGGPRGDPFDAQVYDADSGKATSLTVAADKTLLQVLREAGFDMTFFCEMGGCGACKVTLCDGQVQHNGTALQDKEMASEMLSCVDRGVGKIKIELD